MTNDTEAKPSVMKQAPTAPTTGIPPGKRRLFLLVMACIPLAFFGALEGGLRLAGYGNTYPLFVPVPHFPDYLHQNPEAARRYFVRQARVPTPLGDVFKAEKDSSTFRLFVQGGSSAAGYPYYFGGSFSRMIAQRLQQTFPARRIEVVNTALAAINSYTLLDFADEIIARQPDAVMIYAGHNEYYGALGAGSAESLGQYRAVVNLYLRLQNLRLVQGLRALLVKGGSLLERRADGAPPGATLMERMVGEQTIPYSSALYRRGLAQFRGNLRALLARYRARGIPVFVGTVASNERTHAPFRSRPAPGVDDAVWQARYDEGRQAARRGQTAAALAAFDAAIVLDSLAADAFYAKARTLDDAGRYAEARVAYLAAKDRDQLRFRASEEVNVVIREEAARAGAVVVEVQAALAGAAQDGIIGSDLMLEHLHPNVDGYFILSDAFYHALREAELIGSWSSGYVPASRARAEILVTAVDSLYGAYRLRQLMGSWPFQPPGVVDRSMDTVQARTRIEDLALRLSRRDVNWYEATTTLRDLYKEQGDYHRALQAGLALIQQYPYLPGPYAEAADVLVRQRRYDEALAYFEAANDREASAGVYYMMGALYLAKQQPADAVTYLGKALALEPQNVQALTQMSRAYVLQNQREKAAATLQRLLQIDPNHPEGRQMLAWLAQNPES